MEAWPRGCAPSFSALLLWPCLARNLSGPSCPPEVARLFCHGPGKGPGLWDLRQPSRARDLLALPFHDSHSTFDLWPFHRGGNGSNTMPRSHSLPSLSLKSRPSDPGPLLSVAKIHHILCCLGAVPRLPTQLGELPRGMPCTVHFSGTSMTALAGNLSHHEDSRHL